MSAARCIDLNADLGEYDGEAGLSTDRALMRHITSCSIACGGHAGDDASMRAAVGAALEANVAVGAHPSYPDRSGFGRRTLAISPTELEKALLLQINRFSTLAAEAGARPRHVKPHGALYNDAAKDLKCARAVCAAIARADTRLAVFGPPASMLARAAKDAGLAFHAEGFVDRLYRADGSLTPRSEPGAVIAGVNARAAQAVRLASRGEALSGDGRIVRLNVETLCIHSDSPGAEETARSVRAALHEAGLKMAAPYA